MGLEAGTFINDLVATNPDGSDPKSQGDDHIRLLKRILKATFPNLTGAVTPTQTQINKLAEDGTVCFPGMIVMWSGTIANIPAGWKLCNGVGTISNGSSVPDLRSKFVIGATSDSGGAYNVRQTGGSANSVVVAHTHTATTNTAGSHTHAQTFTNQAGVDGDSWGQGGRYNTSSTFMTKAAGDHAHTVTVASAGESGVGKNIPPYYALAFIIKN